MYYAFHSGTNSFGTMITYYEVKSSLNGGAAADRTNGFVTTDYCQTQTVADQYGAVEIKDNIDQVNVLSIHVRVHGKQTTVEDDEKWYFY